MEMVGAILFAVLLYVITIEFWRFVAPRSRRVLQRAAGAAIGGQSDSAWLTTTREQKRSRRIVRMLSRANVL